MEILKQYEKAILECLLVPNNLLPEKYHNDKTGYVSLDRLSGQCDERDGITKYQKEKRAKAENVANYRKQLEQNEEFEYNGHVNEIQLHKNMMAFCDAHPEIEIDNDDFLEFEDE